MGVPTPTMPKDPAQYFLLGQKQQEARARGPSVCSHPHPHAQSVFSATQGLAQCRPAFDQRHRTKARACRGGRMIDLQITCAPCLAVFASTYVIYSPCQLPCPELIPRDARTLD